MRNSQQLFSRLLLESAIEGAVIRAGGLLPATSIGNPAAVRSNADVPQGRGVASQAAPARTLAWHRSRTGRAARARGCVRQSHRGSVYVVSIRAVASLLIFAGTNLALSRRLFDGKRSPLWVIGARVFRCHSWSSRRHRVRCGVGHPMDLIGATLGASAALLLARARRERVGGAAC